MLCNTNKADVLEKGALGEEDGKEVKWVFESE